MSRTVLQAILTLVLLLSLAASAQAIQESTCPQICTPSCPCSLECEDNFGRPTTCGAYGEPCTNYNAQPSGAEALLAKIFAEPGPVEEPVAPEGESPAPELSASR